VAVAWIGFAGAVVAALIAAAVAWRQSTLSQKQAEMSAALTRSQAETERELARLQSDLTTEQHAREALFDRSLQAEDVLAKYREPLAAAAYDLQSRIYNILRLDFFGLWGNGNARSADATATTLFRLVQYFGWTEILRRKIQYLSFPEEEETRKVARLQSDIAHCFLTHSYGHALMIWSDEQRALGEQMIVEDGGEVLCMGYAKFRERCADTFRSRCESLEKEIGDPGVSERLRDAQHLLCELVETLDSRRVRYTDNLERA
jgi:cell division protein FtsB